MVLSHEARLLVKTYLITAQYENGTYSVAHKTVIEQYIIKWFDVLVEVSFIVESVARTSQSAKSGPWLC